MLVLIDTLADSILLAIDPILFRLGEMTVVRRHVFFLAVFHAGFAVLQITGLFRAQGAVLDAVGDAILLVGFAAVYLIDAGMAGIDYTRSSARGCCGLGNRGTGEHQSADSQDQKRLRDLVDHIGVNPHREE